MSETRKIQRVLVYRLGSLGDMVVALPAFHLIERAFPEADRRLLTSFPPNAKAPAASAVLGNTGLIHGYFRYVYGTRNIGELFRLWRQLIWWRPDILVYVSGTSNTTLAIRNRIFFLLCGIIRSVGIPTTKAMQVCRALPESPPTVRGPGIMCEHESHRLVRNLAPLGQIQMSEAASWDLRFTPCEKARALDALGPLNSCPFFALSVGTKNQSNHWGLENWKALFDKLVVSSPQFALVLFGAATEKEESEELATHWRRQPGAGPALNLCGVLTPRESAAAFAQARLFLGHDSGPAHLAAAVQTPSVLVYGARNRAGIWFPYGKQSTVLYQHVDCEGCRLQVCTIQGKKCILSITVSEVFEQVEAILQPSATIADASGVKPL